MVPCWSGVIIHDRYYQATKQSVNQTNKRKDIVPVLLVDAMVALMVAMMAVTMVPKECKIVSEPFTE